MIQMRVGRGLCFFCDGTSASLEMGNGFDDLFHGLHRQAPFDVDTEKAAGLIGRRRGRERREARRGARGE
jgi:hypothetical protein